MNKPQRNCETCVKCWRDDSVGARECTNAEEMTEDEIETYYSDMKDGCPYYKSQEELDGDYLMALGDLLERNPKANLHFTA